MKNSATDMLDKRSAIYDGIRKDFFCNVETDHQVYLDIRINATQYNELKSAVTDYIMVTLKSFYKKEKFEYTDNFLMAYREKIVNLPNRTPNGAMYPKVENIEEYNKLQKKVNDILVEHGLAKHIEAAAPHTLRVIDGTDSKFKSRHYATTKLHSDAWVGHKGDAILAIGVYGDETTSVEFNKPVGQLSPAFFQVVENFNDAHSLYESKEKIAQLKFGYATLFDHGCLHRTIKAGGGLRVSLEFGVVLKNSAGVRNTYGDENLENLQREKEYEKMNKILKIGKTRFVEASETLQECYKRFKNEDYTQKPTAHITDNFK